MKIGNIGIISGKRTPVGVIGGALRQIPSPLLLASVIIPALDTTPAKLVSSAVFGCSLQSNLGINPVKQAFALAKMDNVSCFVVNSGHSGGIQSFILACQALQLSEEVVMCGGFDSASTCPHSIQGRKVWTSGETVKDELPWAYYTSHGVHYGLALEETVAKLKISRQQQEDYFHHAFKRRKIGLKVGSFDKEIEKLDVLKEDELVFYPEYKNFRPLFYSMGSITSVTSALPSDGAVAIQLGKLSTIQKFGLNTLAIVAAFWKGKTDDVNFYESAEFGVKKVLQTYGLGIHNIDIWEINDFFALIPTVICEKLKIDLEKVNITGGNLAIGDTLSASSSRSILTASLNLSSKSLHFSLILSTNTTNEVTILLLKSTN